MEQISSRPQYNTRSAGVRRLMQEAKELAEPTELYHAQPLHENLFEWHFTVRGPADSDFDGGIYHGRIVFPPEYPMKPPNIILLTPNGRFELNKKICLSISGYHPETWLPSWSIRTALLALVGFMPTSGGGAIGSASYPPEERKRLARLSTRWQCKECGAIMKDVLKTLGDEGKKEQSEARSLIKETAKEKVGSGDSGVVPPPPAAAAPPTSSAPRPPPPSTDWTHFLIIALIILFFAVFSSLLYRRFAK